MHQGTSDAKKIAWQNCINFHEPAAFKKSRKLQHNESLKGGGGKKPAFFLSAGNLHADAIKDTRGLTPCSICLQQGLSSFYTPVCLQRQMLQIRPEQLRAHRMTCVMVLPAHYYETYFFLIFCYLQCFPRAMICSQFSSCMMKPVQSNLEKQKYPGRLSDLVRF